MYDPAHSLDTMFQTSDEVAHRIQYAKMIAPPSKGVFQFVYDACNAVLLLLNVAAAAMSVCDQYEERKKRK